MFKLREDMTFPKWILWAQFLLWFVIGFLSCLALISILFKIYTS